MAFAVSAVGYFEDWSLGVRVEDLNKCGRVGNCIKTIRVLHFAIVSQPL